MTFTIPAFWLGVIATVLGEFIALVVYAVIRTVKDKRNSNFRRK